MHSCWGLNQAVVGSTGAEWTTFNVPTSWPRRNRCMLYGLNDLQLAKPYFFPIYLQTLSFILFVVQVCLTSTQSLCSCEQCLSALPLILQQHLSLYVLHDRLSLYVVHDRLH